MRLRRRRLPRHLPGIVDIVGAAGAAGKTAQSAKVPHAYPVRASNESVSRNVGYERLSDDLPLVIESVDIT